MQLIGFNLGWSAAMNRAIISFCRLRLWLLVPSLCLLCAPALAQTTAAGTPLSFPLKFVEKGSSLSLSVEPGKEEVKFLKEPDFGKNKILRQAFRIGPDKGDFLGFAVDITKRTLYLDLNQNLDLTDDPQGVFQGEKSGSAGSAFFKNVRISFQKNGIRRVYLLESLYYFGDSSGYADIQSSYEGEVELYGRKWRLEVMDNLDGEINDQDQFSIVLAAGGDAKTGRPPYAGMQVPKNLFLDGRQYQLKLNYDPAPETSPLTVHFTEINAPRGDLILDGQFVQRLVLKGNGLVILDSPSQTNPVPVDKYQIDTIYLQASAGDPMLSSSNASEIPSFSITAGAPSHLKIGGPVASSVKAVSRGSTLQLNYLLKGAGGELYTATRPDPKKPPKVVIYQGDRQLGNGDFQFG